MPNTIESVKELVRKAIEKASGWPAIFGPADGPEPANQYCLVTLKRQFKQPHDVIRWTESIDTITENQRSESTLSFEIQVRGKDAMTVADKITSYFDSELRDSDMWPKVGYGGHDDVEDISTFHEGKILPVALVNIDIHTDIPKQNLVEWMNNVDITTKIGNNEFTTTIPREG